MSKSDAQKELKAFVRPNPNPVPPARPPRGPRMSIAPRVFERFSQYIARTNPQPPKRNLNEELGDVKYSPSSGLSCSLLLVILIIR